ncbi:unnamed protein product [Rotaria magnacalcarata]|uniref:Uncharacterized protein n=4 Tax=Rotaria magnacalcarata TaxID=392030 RepID=A0A820HGT5_9BILA|nr:unnamed protein product [Rotaria magnacalcarata]
MMKKKQKQSNKLPEKIDDVSDNVAQNNDCHNIDNCSASDQEMLNDENDSFDIINNNYTTNKSYSPPRKRLSSFSSTSDIFFHYVIPMTTLEEELLPILGNVSSYSGDAFYKLVKDYVGIVEGEILEIQCIKNIRILLRIPDVFSFFQMNSKDIISLKQRACIIDDDMSYVVRAGIRSNIEQFIELLKQFHESKANNSNFPSQTTTSIAIKQSGQFICHQLNMNQENEGFQSKSFINIFIRNILNNMERPSNNYHFDPMVSKFASALSILSGHDAYEFIRLNLPGALPSITTLRNYNQSISLPLRECEFRFESLKTYLDSIDSSYVSVSEDYTSVISSISYDSVNDCFIGFSSRLSNDLPSTNQFRTNSYSELEQWFEDFDKCKLINAHLVEPLLTKTSSLVHSRPSIVSAYGTNNKVNSIEIFRKWIHMYNACKSKKINVVGFSSDCDPRYLKAMRKLFKIDHNLVKSDVRPHDRQNYSSCLKITSDDVLNLLNQTNTKATFVYLYILKLIILAYVKKDTDILNRLYYGWIVVFTYRMWWSSLRIEQNLSQVEKDNCFITKAAWISSEINIHCLTSIIILVSSGYLPANALNEHLFSSQPCEATFRSARSLSGTFSSITNFSVFEFMNKIEKISILNKIKSTEESSNATCSIKFPVHHKNRRNESLTPMNNQNSPPITTADIEKIILKAYKKAESIMNELKLTETLKRNELNDLKKLSSFVFQELSERLIVDYSFVNDDDVEQNSDDEASDANDNTSECSDADYELNEMFFDSDNQNIHNVTTSKETFQGMKIYEHVDPSKMHNYFTTLINNKKTFIHKQTAARLLTKTKNSLSPSRLSLAQQTNTQE